jgi:hypothetical protein
MVSRNRLENLEDRIAALHRRRVIPPWEEHLRTLSTDELRQLAQKLEALAGTLNRKGGPYG